MNLKFSMSSVNFLVQANYAAANCLGVTNGRLEIRENEADKIVICSIKIPLQQDYLQVPITINMGYGFIQSVDYGQKIYISSQEGIVL